MPKYNLNSPLKVLKYDYCISLKFFLKTRLQFLGIVHMKWNIGVLAEKGSDMGWNQSKKRIRHSTDLLN